MQRYASSFVPRSTFTPDGKEPLAPLLIVPREAARALSISERTLFTLTKSGTIPVVRIGRSVRYSTDDLREWVKKSAERD